MKMEYRAEILRGWPADGARERLELIKPGATLQNGDFVQMQADGTVDKSDSTKRARVGLVVRGNLDNALAVTIGGVSTTYPNSSALASGRAQTQAALTHTSATTYDNTTGLVSVTISGGHGLVAGNTVTIASADVVSYNGTFTVEIISSATVYKYRLAPGLSLASTSSVHGTTTRGTLITGGKAIVLWGNYIARLKSDTYTATSMTVGGAVCAVSGKLVAAVGSVGGAVYNGDAPLATFTGTVDPELGFILRMETGSTTEDSHIVISVR